MEDFLINQEEVRISDFAKPALETVGVVPAPVKERKVSVSNKRKNKTVQESEERECLNKNESFILRIDKALEIPIRKALLVLYEKTGKKISIREFVGEAVTQYLKKIE